MFVLFKKVCVDTDQDGNKLLFEKTIVRTFSSISFLTRGDTLMYFACISFTRDADNTISYDQYHLTPIAFSLKRSDSDERERMH